MNTAQFKINTPRISVIMPVYNAQDFLVDAIDSILDQTFTDFELICVDDGSTDGSYGILREYGLCDERVRVISRVNTGIVGALNDGLAIARGHFIARMDADDTCRQDRFEKQIAYLDQHPQCVAVGSWITRTDPYGSPAGTQEPPLTHDEIDQGLLIADGSVLVHATLMLRHDALLAIGGWDSRYDWVEDLDLFLRLAEHGPLANLPEYLYAYRRHVNSVCFRNYELMCQRLKEVMVEAYRRRGRTDLPDFSNIRPELAAKQSAAEHYRAWTCHAIHNGNRKLAYKHALNAMRHQPLSAKSWKVMYWALSA